MLNAPRLALTPHGPALVDDAGRPLLPPLSPASTRVTARWVEAPAHPRAEAVEVAYRLLDLAYQVERLGYGGRHGPEDFVITKLSVAAELRSLAREMDRL